MLTVVCCVRVGSSGKMQVEQAGVPVAVLGPSNLFGDWGVINAEKRTASLSCVTECEVLVIHSYNFLRTVDARVLSSLREKQRLVKGGMPMPAATQLVEDKLRRQFANSVRHSTAFIPASLQLYTSLDSA